MVLRTPSLNPRPEVRFLLVRAILRNFYSLEQSPSAGEHTKNDDAGEVVSAAKDAPRMNGGD